MLYGALEAGGTKMVCAIGNENGEILEQVKFPTETPETTMPQIFEYFKGKDIKALGIACFGPIDLNEDSETYGSITTTPKLAWSGYNIVNAAKEALGIPVGFDTDVNGSLLGEITWGCAKGLSDAIYLTIGTGVGGGIIVNGKILSGSHGSGGEIGHIHMDDNETEKCGCGKCGCLEQYASATGIARLAKRKMEKDDRPSAMRDAKSLNAKVVFDAAKAGDEMAIEVTEEFGEILGKGLANVADVINPELFVIGGGVSKAGQIVIDLIKKNYKKYVFHGSRGTDFALATLGNDAGIYGSAKLVLDGVKNS